jgi:hypothetical protein
MKFGMQGFIFFSIKANEINKQWISCRFGNIMLDLLIRSLNYGELEFSEIKVFELFGKAKINKKMRDFKNIFIMHSCRNL